jgi:DNA repair photolyase
MNKTAIEWTWLWGRQGYTWNPFTGCTHGCFYCYARTLAETRLRGHAGYPQNDPFQPIFHRKNGVKPQPRWIENIIAQCADLEIPCFVKDNAARYLTGPVQRQFPEGYGAEK